MTADAEARPDQQADPHAARRERRRRREREGMQVHGLGVRRLAELRARPGHVTVPVRAARPGAASGATKRRRSKRRRRSPVR
jgi:hypothetical protein